MPSLTPCARPCEFKYLPLHANPPHPPSPILTPPPPPLPPSISPTDIISIVCVPFYPLPPLQDLPPRRPSWLHANSSSRMAHPLESLELASLIPRPPRCGFQDCTTEVRALLTSRYPPRISHTMASQDTPTVHHNDCYLSPRPPAIALTQDTPNPPNFPPAGLTPVDEHWRVVRDPPM